MLRAFAELGGAPPLAVTAHRWRYAVTEPPLQQGYVWDSDLAMGLCGDWLNGGKVEGAWRSGRLLARQVLHALAHDGVTTDRSGTSAHAVAQANC